MPTVRYPKHADSGAFGDPESARCVSQDSSEAVGDTLRLWNRVAVRRDRFASVSDANLPGLAGLYEW